MLDLEIDEKNTQTYIFLSGFDFCIQAQTEFDVLKYREGEHVQSAYIYLSWPQVMLKSQLARLSSIL